VLDPDNRWRDYWIKPPDEIMRTFRLDRRIRPPVPVYADILEYRSSL
jgi:hypothetical protein